MKIWININSSKPLIPYQLQKCLIFFVLCFHHWTHQNLCRIWRHRVGRWRKDDGRALCFKMMMMMKWKGFCGVAMKRRKLVRVKWRYWWEEKLLIDYSPGANMEAFLDSRDCSLVTIHYLLLLFLPNPKMNDII